MKEEKIKKNQPIYKKIIGFCILVSVMVYCFPELKKKIILGVEYLRDEWRKMK